MKKLMKTLGVIVFTAIIGFLLVACDDDWVFPGFTANCTVTFDADGGSPAPSSIQVRKGSSMGNKYPVNPTKTNFIFGGWYNESALYTKDTPINNSITLTAKWELPPLIGEPGTGVTLNKNTLTLTIGAKEKLTYAIASDLTNKSVTWQSDAPGIVSVSSDGTVTALNFSSGGSNRFNTGGGTSTNPTSTPATGTATITVSTVEGGHKDTIVITTTTEALADILTLPPLKDQFAQYFMIGNIVRGGGEITGSDTGAAFNNTRLTRHFNAVTAENHMKPGYLVTGRNTTTGVFTWDNSNRTIADNFVNAAHNAGMAVIGHTLLWHSQNANWMWQQIASRGNSGSPVTPGTAIATKEDALIIMKAYITEVVSRYAGRIHTWDVLNEIFPDNASRSNADSWKTQMRNGKSGEGQDGNPWYIAIGSDFVYEGFLAARLADPKAILYYNDYNTDMPTRALLIRDMVKDVNDRYLALPANQKPAGDPAGRLLIEGIGMQEHHNLGITAARIKTTIDTFKTLNVTGRNPIRLSVSELDIIAYANYSGLGAAGGAAANRNHESQSTNQQLITQANLYNDYMKLYIANADIIERVSIWGITDDTSWRSRGLPLLFDHNGRAKPAYYKFVGALE
ncbi:MAG: endo-1,4-beta-xylanase [Treponema sp.]|nr:endo-1,4-beta-xylanase [Treponema sp.]